MLNLTLLPLIVFYVNIVAAIPIDNGVEGDPDVQCGPNGIVVDFKVRNTFQGNVYVKGLFKNRQCKTKNRGQSTTKIEVQFNTCSAVRERSLNPRGVFIKTTVIISFHPNFITKVDRAFSVRCFYMEAEKTVRTGVEVSMLTTESFTQGAEMPTCRYEILDGGPSGRPVAYALVGQQVYHKWTCVADRRDSFCMRVHSCIVDDGTNDRVKLLDSSGCALDKYLLRNLHYGSNLMAGQEIHVFKYADKPQLFFQCQISVMIKEPGRACSLPECSNLRRNKRNSDETEGIVDVSTTLNTLDLDSSNKIETGHVAEYELDEVSDSSLPHNPDLCFSKITLILLISISVSLVMSAMVVLVIRSRSVLNAEK